MNTAETTTSEMVLRDLQGTDLASHLYENMTIGEDSDMRKLLTWIPCPTTAGFAIIAWVQKNPVAWSLLYFNKTSDKAYGDVFVHPDCRKRGLGTRLCQELMAVAAREDRKHLIVSDDPVWRKLLDGAGYFEKEGHPLLDYEMPT